MPGPAYVRIDVKTVFNAWFVRIIEKYAGVADSTDSSDSGIDEDRELTWIFKQMYWVWHGPMSPYDPGNIGPHMIRRTSILQLQMV